MSSASAAMAITRRAVPRFLRVASSTLVRAYLWFDQYARGLRGARAVVEEACNNPSMSILEGPLRGATRTEVGGLAVDDVAVGTGGHLKRIVYPPGWRWSKDMRPVTGSDLCMHAHVGMLVQGRIAVEYADGCREEFDAPAAVVVAPGHDGWVVGDEAAVLVQYDCGADTVERLGLAASHGHDADPA
jgi:hypothetical protein